MSIFNNQFSQLESALTQIDAPPADELAARIAALPRPGKLPSPASIWLLFFLIRYGRRQRSMRRRLARCLPDVFSDEDLTSGAALPGMPQWRLTLKAGHLIIVAHQVTGEQLAINDRPLGDEHMVLAAFIPTWLRPRSMWDVDGRLLASIGSGSILTAIEELVAARILVEIDFFGFVWEKDRFPEGHRLAYWVRRMCGAVSRFCRLWAEETDRLWLAAIIGDWPSADELAQSHDDPEVQRVVAEKLEAYQKRRVSIARGNFILNPDSVADLAALCEEGVEDFATFAEHAIAALGTDIDLAELLMNTNDSRWDPYLLETLQRTPIDSSHELMPFVAFSIAEGLLDRNYRAADVLKALAGYHRELARVAVLFLQYAPAQALPVIRRALRYEHVEHWSAEKIARHGPPSCLKDRRRMAAVLSVIDRPWSRGELIAAIRDLWEERHDPAESVPLVLALGDTGDAEARAIGESWQARLGNYEHLEHEQSLFLLERNAVSDEAFALRDVSVTPQRTQR